MAMSRPVKPEDLLLGLECPVCHDHYRTPKMLPCGHTLCLSPCLEQITDGKPQLRCPECRTEHVVPEGGVNNFPTNVTVARLFEAPKQAELSPGCPICGETEERTKCFHCGLLVCDDCKQSHNLKFRDQLVELLASLKDEQIPKAKASSDKEMREMEMKVQKKVDNAVETITQMQGKAHEIIDDEVTSLIQKVKEFGRVEMENFKVWSEHNEAKLQDSVDFCDCEIKSLKRKIPAHSKMAKLLPVYNMKQQAVMQTNRSLQRVVRDINITTDLQPLEDVAKSLAQVIVTHVQDTTEQQEACEEMSEDKSDIDKANVDKMSVDKVDKETMTEAQPSAKPRSVLDRDTSSVKLCVGSQGSGDANLQYPYGVAVDRETKDVIIADQGNHRIQVFDKDGQHKRRFGSGGTGQEQFKYPEGVTLTPEGHIVITDYSNHRVKMYTRHGSFIRMFGKQGSGPGEFVYPRGVAVDREGNIHVCDTGNKRVQVFGHNGESKYQYNVWKSVCDESPFGISINRKGNIAVTFSNNIAIINKQLHLVNTFKQSLSYDISWIDDDHLLVPDHNNHVLKVYTVSGELVKQFGEPGHCVGQLLCPVGVAVDDEGFVYVASNTKHTVQKY